MRRVDRKWQWPGNTPNSPSEPGAMTSSTCWLSSSFSGVTTSNRIFPAIFASSTCYLHRPLLYLHTHLLRLRDHFLNRSHHIEGLFRQMVVFAVQNFFEAPDGILQLHILTRRSREGFGNMERLGKKALDLSR